MEMPTPPQTEGSSRSAHSLGRRRVQDSSTEGSDISGISRSSPGAYTAERFRVGIPALQLLPLYETLLPSTAPALIKFREFLPRIEQILRDREVEYDENEVELLHRNIPGEELSEDDLTVVILAEWSNDADGQKWLLAAEDIHTVLLSSHLTRRINVELLSWQLTAPRTMLPLEPNHPLVGAWTRVNPRIHTVLEKTARLQETWKSIDVLRLGYVSEDYQETPVTISITVDWILDRRDWALAERQIAQVLAGEELHDVEVEFERGDVYPMTFPIRTPTMSVTIDSPDIHMKEYPQRVPMGSDFGPEKYFPEGNGPTATIGGFLEVLQPDQTYQKYAFTNYHCARGILEGFAYIEGPEGSVVNAEVPINSQLDKIDNNGMDPMFDRTNMTFESPSRRKHNFTLQYHDEEIQSRRSRSLSEPKRQLLDELIADHERRRAQKVQFFDEERHKYGRLWMCSGLKQRTKHNGRLDIALIDVKSIRLGDNTVPDVSAWPLDQAPIKACGKLLHGLESCKEGVNLGPVFKVGSATRNTSGQFSAIKSDVRMEWDKRLGIKNHSTEYCFVTRMAVPFTSHGDSGSFFFEDFGSWVGAAFGGSTKGGVREVLNYVMDAQDILDWINEKRGNVNAARLAMT